MQVQKVQIIPAIGIITEARAQKIYYEYWTEKEDGKTYTLLKGVPGWVIWGRGENLFAAVDDLLDALYELSCSSYKEGFEDVKNDPEKFLLVLKMLICSKQEILSCLVGEICRDI